MRKTLLLPCFAVIAACATAPSELPLREPNSVSLGVSISGTLSKIDECYLITDEKGRKALPIWPYGSRIVGNGIALPDGQNLELGSFYVLTGGYASDSPDLRPRADACGAEMIFNVNSDQGDLS